jgi:hypothetical protein
MEPNEVKISTLKKMLSDASHVSRPMSFPIDAHEIGFANSVLRALRSTVYALR